MGIIWHSIQFSIRFTFCLGPYYLIRFLTRGLPAFYFGLVNFKIAFVFRLPLLFHFEVARDGNN